MKGIEKYNSLEINKKADLLWEHGLYFDERVDYGKFSYKYYYFNNCDVLGLKKVEEFVVELRYNIKGNRIDNIEAMKYFSNDNTTLKYNAI